MEVVTVPVSFAVLEVAVAPYKAPADPLALALAVSVLLVGNAAALGIEKTPTEPSLIMGRREVVRHGRRPGSRR